jgi:hypothetical protein
MHACYSTVNYVFTWTTSREVILLDCISGGGGCLPCDRIPLRILLYPGLDLQGGWEAHHENFDYSCVIEYNVILEKADRCESQAVKIS